MVEDARPPGLGHELRAEPDEAPGRHEVLDADPAVAVVDQLLHPPLAGGQELLHRPQVVVGDEDRHALHRLAELPVDLPGHHLGLAHGELEPLPPHRLDEHGQLELAPALDLPGVGPGGPALHQPGGELGAAALAGQRRRVDPDGHRQAGLVDADDGQRPGVDRVGQGLADGDVGEPGHGDDLSRPGRLGGDAMESLGDEQLGDLHPLDLPVGPAPGHHLAAGDGPLADPAHGQAAEIGGAVEVGHQGLEWVPVLVGGGGDALHQQLEEGLQRRPLQLGVERRPAVPGVGIDDGELDLVVVGVEVEEQLVDLVDHMGHTGVGPVDLVDDQDDGEPGLERLAEHEAGLGLGPLRRVDQQEDAVDHGQRPLDLAAEVGVARGVDDVQLHAAEVHRRVLGQDGDALLPLQVGGVHDPVAHVLVLPEHSGLPEHGVDQGRLAVVDVGHDGDVAQVVTRRHGRNLSEGDRAIQKGTGPC